MSRSTTLCKAASVLDGNCPEAVQLPRDRRATGTALRELREVLPLRQVEIAELTCAANNVSVAYARCLVAATLAGFLAEAERCREARACRPRGSPAWSRSWGRWDGEFRLVEESHGRGVLHLLLVVGYLRKLLPVESLVRADDGTDQRWCGGLTPRSQLPSWRRGGWSNRPSRSAFASPGSCAAAAPGS